MVRVCVGEKKDSPVGWDLRRQGENTTGISSATIASSTLFSKFRLRRPTRASTASSQQHRRLIDTPHQRRRLLIIDEPNGRRIVSLPAEQIIGRAWVRG